MAGRQDLNLTNGFETAALPFELHPVMVRVEELN